MSVPAGVGPARTGARTLRDVFTIPEVARADDYVLRLSASVQSDQVAGTLATYVVTDELAHAFDQALAVVEEAQRTGQNKAAFLEGSFGSGKSHFMAVLHAILGRHPQARAIHELQPILDRHRSLESANLLRLTFHFLDSESVESTLFRQYLEQIAALHPDNLPPVLHSAQGLFDDAAALRRTLGDDAFLAGLNATAPGSGSLWGRLGVGSADWTAQRYNAATAPTAARDERRQVQQALMSSHFTSFSRNTDWLSLDEGLSVIAEHARSLGYDGVVLLLDELMLWLTFIISERERLNREVQKITKLVEGSRGRLAVPITSFLARQHDLRRWLGTGTSDGANQDALEQSLAHQSGRFTTIVLGDENLPAIAHRRLLLPKDEDAAAALQQAFTRVDRSPAVWDVLRDGVNATEDHRGADAAAFRLTYPFSPALIDTLKNLAGLMQRERTTLKVMQKMLVDNADRLTVDNVIPVGEAFDDIITGTTTSSDPQVTVRFRLARDLWFTKLRPRILEQHHLAPDVADADLPPGARAEMRLAKTLVLAAIAPNVPALKQITPARLAALNHGSIREVLPGDAATQALHKVRSWQAVVPEVRTSDESRNPVITVTLAEVDYEGVIARARSEDTEGRRRDLVRDLLFDAVGVADLNAALGGVRTRQIPWKGTLRDVDILFGNVRDPAFLPDDAFRARPGTVRLIMDYPFDDPGRTAAQDHVRVERMRDNGWDEFTVAWLPGFFTDEQNRLLGQLVVLNTVLGGEKWAAYAADLPELDRPAARAILEAQRSGIRGQIGSLLAQVYGVASGYQFPEGEEPLRSLTPNFTPRRPVGASLGECADRLIADAFAARYPHHPDFSPPNRAIPEREISQTLRFLREADGNADGRVALDRPDRDLVRRIVHPLELAKVNETHLVFTATEFSTWDNRISQALSRHGVDTLASIDVETLRHAVNPAEAGRGLSDPVRDLVVGAWASRHRRAWYLHGSPVDEPGTVREIRADLQLRTEPLPDSATWTAALDRSARLFGAPANPHLTANNLTSFVRDTHRRIAETLSHQQRLVTQLDDLYANLGLAGDRARRALAGSIRDLLQALERTGQDRVGFVEVLAGQVLNGTDVEAGRSIATAESVAAEIARTNWRRFGIVREASTQGDERGRGALEILDDLAAAATDQEYNKPLVAAITTADDVRQRWLERWQTRAPVPAPPDTPPDTPPPTPPDPARPLDIANAVVSITGNGDWSDLDRRIRAVLAAHTNHEFDVLIDVRARREPGDTARP
jgi:hypothetical protein